MNLFDEAEGKRALEIDREAGLRREEERRQQELANRFENELRVFLANAGHLIPIARQDNSVELGEDGRRITFRVLHDLQFEVAVNRSRLSIVQDVVPSPSKSLEQAARDAVMWIASNKASFSPNLENAGKNIPNA